MRTLSPLRDCGACAAFALLALASPLAAASGQTPTQSSDPTVTPVRTNGGEMRPGDRIVLWVLDEPSLTDTFTVAAGPSLTLPLVGHVDLAGVTRTELPTHLSTVLARVIREPEFSVQTLVRLAILGEVARPGFFAVPSDALLSDAITLAGGPTGNAEMRRLVLSRRGAPIQRDEQLRKSIADGRTIEDLGITAGDELMVPRRHDGERTARIIGLLVGVPVGIFAITRM